MKPLRILVLAHEDLLPPDSMKGFTDEEILEWKCEFDVLTTLQNIGHDAQIIGVRDDLGVIRQKLSDFNPHITFNLLDTASSSEITNELSAQGGKFLMVYGDDAVVDRAFIRLSTPEPTSLALFLPFLWTLRRSRRRPQ